MKPRGVPALRTLIRIAEAAGFEIRMSGGDYIVRGPQKYLRINCRRKDGTPELAKVLREAGLL